MCRIQREIYTFRVKLVESALLAVLIVGCTASPSLSPTTVGATPIPATPTPTEIIPTAIPTAEDIGPVHVWMTSADQSRLLEPQPDISFGSDAGDTLVVYVNENNRYQQMDGFGASMTDSSAWLIYTQMPEAQRKTLMSELFSPDGIGISAMRIPMGASDFVNGQPYTYDDMPPGQADSDLVNFSIEHDKAYIIPALQDALKLNPNLKLIASPWSPPAWMKTSDSLLNGTLQKQYYDAFTQYFVRFIQAYQAAGLPIYAITIQNEPYYEPNTYPGMRLEPADEAELVKNYFGPAFEAAGINTKILIWDHNWDEWKYPLTVLDDPEAKAILDGTAFHCYAGSVIAQGIVHDAHPDKNLYFTECSGGTWIPSYTEGFKSDLKNLVIGSTRYWAKTVIKWNIALDTSHNPHHGGCATCDGLVTIDPQAESGFTYNFDYYTIGHLSKFVLPGAYRIASSTFTYDGFESVAFQNPDSGKVLILANTSNKDIPFVLRWGNRALAFTIPAETAATFTWDGTQANAAPPAQPLDLRTTVNPGKNLVKWEFSPLAVTYTLKRSDQPGGPYKVVASGINVPEFLDTQVAAGSTYYYVVSAVNELGESPDSAEASAMP